MSDETPTETEEWLCMGRRAVTGNKLRYAWLDPTGRELLYAKVKGIVGRRYSVEVDRSDPETMTVYGGATYVDSLAIDDPRRVEWEAIERSDMAEIERDRIEAKDAKESALADLCAPLHELYRKQVGPHRRAAFLAVVTEMITR